MKKLLFLTRVVLVSAALALAASCTKTIQQDSFAQDKVLGEKQALEEFAVILSDAVADNEEMREFIKEEALKQFDKDYDVFYPYVKDHVFSSGESFREILSAREKYEGQLEAIERSVPKLTVLVPNFSWLDEEFFCAEKWDTSIDRLCVGYDDDADAHRLYFDGEYQGALPASDIPAFPVLIVKSNERMSVSGSTKSGENVYAFADPAFDGSVSTKGVYEGYIDNPEPGEDLYSVVGNNISADELSRSSPETIAAINEFQRGAADAVQRDYIYYGMTKTNTNNGQLNPYMRDMLYRIRFTPYAISAMSDDSNDPADITGQIWNTKKGDRPGFGIVPRIWGKGNYEIRLLYFQNYPNTGVYQIGSSVLALDPLEIFYVKRVYRKFEWNIWGNDWSKFTITKADIESKWYYPGDKPNPIQWVNTTWNLATMSDNIWVKVVEYDPAGTESYSDTKTFKKSWSVTVSVNGESPVGEKEGKKIGYGVSGTYGDEEPEVIVFSWTRNVGSDELGEFEMRYTDRYATKDGSKTSGGLYNLNDWGNEYFSVCFLPIDSRKEYEIRQALLGRKSRNK